MAPYSADPTDDLNDNQTILEENKKPVPTPQEIQASRQVKRQLVRDEILSHCLTAEAKQYPEFQRIAEAIAKSPNDLNNVLQVDIISGGYSNFSYKISLVSDPSVRLFAKLCFSHASWNMGEDAPAYDLNRTKNEYAIMDRMHALLKTEETGASPIPKPYLCKDVSTPNEPMMLLVTEWSLADEQFGNQFIQGTVDPRIAPQLAHAVATLHTIPFDAQFNEGTRAFMNNAVENAAQPYLLGLVETTKEPTVLQQYAHDVIGMEKMKIISDRVLADFHATDCLIHKDLHAHNMLVESGDGGALTICDWELCTSGAIGRDVGAPLGWPLYCAMVHAWSGRPSEAAACLRFVTQFLDSYLNELKILKRVQQQGNENYNEDAFLRETFRNGIAGCGMFTMHGYHIFRAFQDILPFGDDVTEKDRSDFDAASGRLALRFLEFGYLDDTKGMSLEELRKASDDIIQEEIQSYSNSRYKIPPRRPSSIILQASLPGGLGRVSDAHLYHGSSILEEP